MNDNKQMSDNELGMADKTLNLFVVVVALYMASAVTLGTIWPLPEKVTGGELTHWAAIGRAMLALAVSAFFLIAAKLLQIKPEDVQ